jgi:hypothetical protein
MPFCILNVLGDVLDDGELYFVKVAQSLDAAKARVQSLAELWPGEYVIYDEATGERVSITAGGNGIRLVKVGRSLCGSGHQPCQISSRRKEK